MSGAAGTAVEGARGVPGERGARFVLWLNAAILCAMVAVPLAAVAWPLLWWFAFPPHRVQQRCVTTNAGWTAYERVVDYALPPKTISTVRLTRDLDVDPMGTFVGRLHYGTVLLGIDWIDARHLRVRTDTDPEYPEREVEGIAIDWQVARR